METKLPTLRRPKKKLCYLTNKESPAKKVEGLLTMEDIDRMFDDLDPPCDDLLPSSSRYITFNVGANQSKREASTDPQKGKLMGKIPKGHMGPKGDEIHPSRSLSPQLVIDQDIPFKAHMPAKTSSPIDINMAVKALDIEKDRAMSPLLFACEEDGDAKTEPPPNGHVTEESIDFEFESPPSKVVISRPKRSSEQNKVEEARKESQTLKINPPQKPQTPVVEVQRKTPRIEMVDPPAAAVRREPELAAPEKRIETVPEQPLVEPVRVHKNIAAFLQKLRDAAQSKPACTRKSASPMKVPTPPPEPEDDFLILEDDPAPFWVSIRSKTAKKQKRSGTTSIVKGSVTDKSTKGSSAETQQEPEETERKPRGPSGKRKTKKTKEKKNEVTEAEEELPGPEEPPVDSIDEKRPNEKKPNEKKQGLKKVPSEDSDEEEEPPKTSKETQEDEPIVRIDKKALYSKTLKDAKTSRAKPMKRGKKVPQGSDGETDKASKKQGPSSEEVGATDLGALSDKEIMNPEAQTDEDSADVKRDTNNKLPVVSEGSSPDDSLTLGRRRRRPPGEWWMHQSPEETTGKCNQPKVKEATRQNKEPSAAAAAASPVRPKKDKYDQLTIKKYKKPNQEPSGASPVKDKVLKNINPTQSAAPTSQKTNKGKEKKQNTRGETQGEEGLRTVAEPFEEQQEEEEGEGQDDVQSSPLVFSHRELSDNSGEKPFPKVYHPVSSKKKAPQRKEPQRKESLKAVRQGSRPPGSWCAVPDVYEDVESVSPQQEKPKLQKEKKKRIRSPPPPKESSSVPLLNPESPVKRSRAASEDMLSSNETPSVGRGRMKRRKEPERPVEEIPPADGSIFGNPNDLIHHSTPEDEGTQRYSVDRSKLLRSGPSSMIVLDQYEEDSLILPNCTLQAALSLSDLCAPPLKRMTLLTHDKANLSEWFTSLWALPVKVESTEVFPDQFEWFCYQGRVIGFTVDVNSGSICNGKMLLGSFMKKPLWVDHSAATVFNLLTSSVSVTINGRESRFNPGRSFMVPCGSAYSIQNVCAQPAVLYFTRILTESSE